MATALGNITISNAAVGGSAATALALGDVVVWQLGPEPAAATPLCFTAEQASSSVRLDKNGSPDAVSLETSTDGTSWTDYTWSGTTGSTISLASIGDKVYFRAKTENLAFSTSYSDYYKFIISGKVAASGSIQSLLKADCSRTDAPEYFCYNMFKNLTALTTPPELPATLINFACYDCMFEGCQYMVAAPALPATTLANNCYSGMFKNCKALKDAPALPSQTVLQNSYGNMFFGDSSLSSMEVALTAWSSSSDTINWLFGVAASGTFTCPSTLPDTRGTNNIPNGWTKVDAT